MAELRNAPMQQRSREKLERVLSAAEHLLNAAGPEQLTTRQVAEVAGVSVGAVYRLFPDKSAIIRSVVDRYLHEWSTGEVPNIPSDFEIDPNFIDVVVRAFTSRSVNLLAAHPGWRRLRTWHYEDTGLPVREPVFSAQVEAVSTVIALTIPTVKPATADLVAMVICEASWPLLDRVADADDPELLIEEIVILTTSYLTARFDL